MTNELCNIDFHRNAFILVPEHNSERYETYLIEPSDKAKKPRLFCSCSTKKYYAECSHATQLKNGYEKILSITGNVTPYEHFLKNIYWKIIEPITRVNTSSADMIECKMSEDKKEVMFYTKSGALLFTYQAEESVCGRLTERLTKSTDPSRYVLMNRGLDFIRTDQEKALIEKGFKTQRQTVEDSIWYRLAYHCYRENPENPDLSYEINNSGEFVLSLISKVNKLHVIVFPKAVHGIINGLLAYSPEKFTSRVSLQEHELLFRMIENGKDFQTVSPCINYKDSDELQTVHTRFVYDNLVYLPSQNILIKLSTPGLKLLATGWGEVKKIPDNELSAFLDLNESALSIGTLSDENENVALDLFANVGANDYKRITGYELITKFDRVELCPLKMDNELCTISIRYSVKDHSVLLADLLRVKKEKKRFLIVDTLIVDCDSKDVRNALVASRGIDDDGTLTLSRAALLQFRGTSLVTKFTGDEKLVKTVRQMLEFKPVKELKALSLYNGNLREYQKLGVQWLMFLYDNNFGGLLSDDMGLGKTHQVLAFIAATREQRNNGGPVLVVCPTTVISHWKKVVDQFAPSMKLAIYHSADRSTVLNSPFDILVTSYGILRNDVEQLRAVKFDIVVFDEAHLLKNKETSSYLAASRVGSNTKIALTGTPIENSITDLKALFDLILPGLLSTDLSDEEILFFASNSKEQNKAAQQLQRLTGPFILRRLKQSVLSELPPKIEDIRTCSLSTEQGMLYQSAIEKKADPLIRALQDENEPVPYIHIFSLLNHMKQICNHPALLSESPAEVYESTESGKFELFKELIDEGLGSDQKIVVFSQYLGMIDIIHHYLDKLGVGNVVLTGASKKRDQIIKRFAEDKDCRVFIGSLKAGGVGIDLVAGSVVIHYDRWWNAARENQATDRVHRIGQKRGVQVFKLVTEGTVEEHIDKIIEQKKTLAECALTEDNPEVLKQFSREDLIELLSMRGMGSNEE